MKNCRICHETKTKDNFLKHPGYRDGLDTRCKQCKAEAKRVTRDRRRGPRINPYEGLVPRICLKCEVKFQARGRFERMCLDCKKDAGSVMI